MTDNNTLNDETTENRVTEPTETHTIEVPNTLMVEFRDEITNKEVTLKGKSLDWLLWAISNGLKQSIADAIAGKVGTEEGVKLIVAKHDRVCKQGLIPAGGGGGGPKQTAEIAGWITYFKSKGSPVKFKGEIPNGKTLDKYQNAFTKKAIWPSVQKVLLTMTKAEQVEFHEKKLPALIKKHKAAVIQAAEADQNGVGQFIEAEKLKRAGKKPEQFHVDISIEM